MSFSLRSSHGRTIIKLGKWSVHHFAKKTLKRIAKACKSMPWTNAHLAWLAKTKDVLSTADGKPIEVWEFKPQDDPKVLKAWAKHFRNHYCLDTEIDVFRKGTGLTRKEFLETLKFPHASKELGPATRAGDFGEIIVADYLQYVLGYWVPRTRYGSKNITNESSKGCDTLAFRFIKDGSESPGDILALYETKTQFTGKKPKPRLQDAIGGSARDPIRKAESLHAAKQHFLIRGDIASANRVERFQDMEDRPYKEVFGAVALFSLPQYCAVTLGGSTTKDHPHKENLSLVVIRGKDMMPLVHELYRRAANEA
jgi:hypothetical protein